MDSGGLERLERDVTQLLYNEAQGRAMLGGIGRSKFYELVADGKIKAVKIGRRTFIAHEELVRYVASLNEAA